MKRPRSPGPAGSRRTASTDSLSTAGGLPKPLTPSTGVSQPDSAALSRVCRSALLVVGNYHAVMAGLVLKKEKFYLKFAIKHHVGNVNDVAVTDRYVASCGADERVFLFTNKAEQKLTAAHRAKLQAAGETMAVRLADLGSLTPPCEVLCLAFTNGSQYLLCGCAEGQLLVYRTRDWSLSNTLEVHEKQLLSFAVHPATAGTLVVSVGADRSVAVLDLAKGRLLTKWKYTPVVPAADAKGAEGSGSAPDGESADSVTTAPVGKKPTKQRAKKDEESNPLARLFAREEPVRVVFSPAGTRFLIQARFSFVVYTTATMQPERAVRLSRPPQPQEEIQSVVFIDEETVLIGNEAAQVLYYHLGAGGEGSEGSLLRPVAVSYPEGLRAEADALRATPVCEEVEVRKKNPLRHVSRVKALKKVGTTLFSFDSNGIVISWTLLPSDPDNGAVRLQYVTSANCQGRATSLDALPL